MNIGNLLYTIVIGPLKLLFEVIYTIAYYLTGSAGLSIIALSLVMNVLLLPLYSMADRIQEEENRIQKNLKKGVDHIKKVFKGDEQYMILNTYYRQNNYKPIYALRSSISLLLEIPFFIAAYDFLSNEYTVLAASFGPISNLGSPDGLLGGINLLPIAMTAINILSSIIYTKGQPFKQNVQLYIMALAFLFFLYDRPAGLVFYWTLNNLFSLIKNIVVKIKHSDIIISVILSFFGALELVLVLFIHPMATIVMQSAAVLLGLILQIPLIFYWLTKRGRLNLEKYTVEDHRLFYLEVIFLTLFFGLFIPCRVIGSSPNEFLDLSNIVNPIVYILRTLALSAGTFCIWVTVYYSLMSGVVKKAIQYFLMVCSFIFTMNFLLFGTDLGTMSNTLIYHDGMQYKSSEILLNILCVILLASLISYAFGKFKQQLRSALIVMTIGVVLFSFASMYQINKDVKGAIAAVGESKTEKAKIQLSKKGKNVVMIILDRAINSYFPYILNEIDGLEESYSGFTYYPNTVSFGAHTNLAIPAIYGGYEYTPEEMDKRSDEDLMDKHNESLKVLPVLFEENGYDVTVFDPCYANYSYPSDLSIFDEYPSIKRYNTEIGMFDYDKTLVKNSFDSLNRNLFCFGLTKSVPLFLQNILYNGGAYNSIEAYNVLYSEDSKSIMSFQAYVEEGFLKSFSVLSNMINITDIKNDDSDNLLLMYNNSTHEPTLLQEPDYELKRDVDNYDYDVSTDYSRMDGNGNRITFESHAQISHYQINVASFKELGKWLDYLKENDVYDNTRIIIVADHGKDLNQFADMIYTYEDGEKVDLMKYNPILLYKDFDSDSYQTDEEFMTNADAASLAVKDVIKEPINPFTGEIINSNKKTEGQQHIFMSDNYMIHINNGKKYIPGKWMYVKDNIFDLNNWTEDKNQ